MRKNVKTATVIKVMNPDLEFPENTPEEFKKEVFEMIEKE